MAGPRDGADPPGGRRSNAGPPPRLPGRSRGAVRPLPRRRGLGSHPARGNRRAGPGPPPRQPAADQAVRAGGHFTALVELLERRADAPRGEERIETLCAHRRALRGPARRPRRGHAPLRGGARRSTRSASPRCAGSTASTTAPAATRSCSRTSSGRSSCRRDAAPEDQALRAHRRHPRRGVPRSRQGRRGARGDPGDRQRPRGRDHRAGAPLPRARSLGGRGQPLRDAAADRRPTTSAASSCCSRSARVLVEQVGSPERAPPGLREGARDRSRPRRRARVAGQRARRDRRRHGRALRDRVARRQGPARPSSKADLWIRAAKILEEKGDRDGAIERYKRRSTRMPATPSPRTRAARGVPARAATPPAPSSSSPARSRRAEGNLAKARLYGEMAQLSRDAAPRRRARRARRRRKAVDLDPTSIARPDHHRRHRLRRRPLPRGAKYESLANRVDALAAGGGRRLLMRYVDALAKSGADREGHRH